MSCNECGEKPKKACGVFPKAVIEIDNPEKIVLLRKVMVPASMGDESTFPPTIGKYHNVLLYYEANQKSYLYSSDGIPTQLVNGLTDYEAAINLPQINGNTLIGDKTGEELGLQDKLTAGDNITIENNVISATDTTYGPATNTEIGLVKPGDGLEVDANGTISISDIEQYAHFFDTVADMKASTDLVNGNYVRTLGYYSKDDMGGACYKISSTAPSGYYEILTSGLYAELILEGSMNVRQFGAKGDGASDDTTKIQNALDSVSTVIVPAGTYMVDAITHINMNTGNKLLLDNEGEIKAIANSAEGYSVIRIENVQDVTIIGGKITGERGSHTGEEGEWGNCIDIRNSSNILLKDIYISEPWGDGLYISGVDKLYTQNLFIKNARRNGISVISVSNYTSLDDTIEDVYGTGPSAGIDFEPNLATEHIINVKMTNFTTRRTAFGVCFALSKLDGTSDALSVELNGFKDYASSDGIRMTKLASLKGTITLNDMALYDNPVNPVALRNFTWGQDFMLYINGLYIKRSSAEGTNHEYAAIRAYGAYTPMGGIVFKNTSIYQDGVDNGVPDMYLNGSKGISIITPIHKTKLVSITNIENFYVSDPLYTYSLMNGSGAGAVGSYEMRTRSIKDTTASSDSTVNFNGTAPIGFYCQFINANATRTYSIQLPDNYYCRALSNDAAITIVLSPGATITLVKIDNSNIVPIAQSGTITTISPTP